MKNKNNIILCKTYLYIFILISLLNSINSVNFFPLENAKEQQSLNNSLLILEIKGVVSSAVNNNLSFSIESELYKDNELISGKNYINCTIPKNPKAVFGTVIISKCEFDLFYTPLANTILFSKFISNIKKLKIEDPNNYILGQNLTFSKNLNITPNFEYVVEDLKSVECLDNKYTLGIIGEIDRIFVSSFNFNFTINPNTFIKANCTSPYIYFTRKTMINCTIDLIKDDTNFEKEINKGIILKENYYRVINEEGEKILKMKIGNNKTKIEFKDLNCKEEKADINETKNITDSEDNLNKNKTNEEIETNLEKINEEKRNESTNIENNLDKHYSSNEIKDVNNSSNLTTNNVTDDNKEINITKTKSEEYNNSNVDDIIKNKTIENNNTEINNKNNTEENITIIEKNTKIDNKNNEQENTTSLENNTTKDNSIGDNDISNITNITENNITEKVDDIKNKTDENITEKADDIKNKTDENITEKADDIKNKTDENITENDNNILKNNSLNNTDKEKEIEQEKINQNNINETKNDSILINETSNETIIKESIENNQINKALDKNESIINAKDDNLTTKENQIEEPKSINNNTNNNSNSIDNNTLNNSLNETDLKNNTIKNNSNIENNTNSIITNEISDSTNREERQVDDYTKMWEFIRNRGNNSKKQKEKAEIEKEERKEREWERKREEERKKKEEEEKQKEEERKRKEYEEMMKIIKEREEKQKKEKEEKERKEKEEKERLEKEEKERKEKEEKERLERERLEKEREDNLRNRENNNENQNNLNNNLEPLNPNNIDVKLIHLQFRYTLGTVYYMFYSLTPIPKGHKIKIHLSISKSHYARGFNQMEYQYVILKTEQEINKDDKNIIVEYIGLLDCLGCKRIILNQNNIEGATIYNIPENQSLRDGIYINRNNYITRSEIKSPLLYVTENISNNNCIANLEGKFFNRNNAFTSKFNLILITTNSNQNNVTVPCQLNEKKIFTCPVQDALNNYEYKLEQFIIDKKENIIIDNSLIINNNIVNKISCEKENNKLKNDEVNSKDTDNPKSKKKSKKKKIIIGGICILILVYIMIDFFCCYEEEPHYQYSSSNSSSRGSISNSNYVGETSGLINRRW